jgi:hypothetical protein
MAKHQLACKTALAVSIISLGLVGCGGGDSGSTSSTTTPATSTTQGIQKVTITSTTPSVFGATSFGSAGTYDKIEGIAYGQIDPNDPKNQVIADIAFAQTNSVGMVEYTTPFYILKPSNLAKGNGKVFYEAPNRGGKQYGSFNQTGGGNDPGTSAADATLAPTTVPATTAATYPAFLMNQGYSLVWSAWDAEPMSSTATKLLIATLPIAKQPSGAAIAGPMYEYIVNDNKTTTCAVTYYSPVEGSTATLTVRNTIAETAVALASTDWSWGGPGTCSSTSKTSNSISLKSGAFTQSAIYELTYTAKDPYIATVGFAAIRDFASFLKYSKADNAGTANPLSGSVNSIVGYGLSQPARLWNDYVWLGFNQDVNGKKVFDGLFNWIGGGNGLGINYRFAQVGRTERNRQHHIAQLEGVFPFSYTTTTDPLSGKTDGRNVRCTASNTCPKVMNIYSANEIWVKTGSLLTTDPTTGLPVAEPSNVRNYFVASAQHGNGSPSTTAPTTCSQFTTTVDPNPLLRGLWVALDSWVTTGTAPPASVNPSITAGTATFIPTTGSNTKLGIGQVPLADVGYPNLPAALNQFSGLVTVRNYWNFGSTANYNKGILDIIPPIATGSFYKASVPKTDADGNDLGGVILPELVAPIATNSGWALRSATFGGSTNGLDGCESTGQSVPFAKDDTSKITGDPRASLAARYTSKADWVSRRAAAAVALQNKGFLLQKDVDNYTTSGNNTLYVNQTATSTTPLNTNYPTQYSYSW